MRGPENILKRELAGVALAELNGATIRPEHIPEELHEPIRSLAVLCKIAPDLRQHPEWFVVADWLTTALDQHGAESGLRLVQVKGIADDAEVCEWWCSEHDGEELENVQGEHRLAFIDEYVRQRAEYEVEDVPPLLVRMECVLPDGTTFGFNLAMDPDWTFDEGPVMLARYESSLATAVARFEREGYAVGWELWLSRPESDRIQVGKES